jgi:hypothetical protein
VVSSDDSLILLVEDMEAVRRLGLYWLVLNRPRGEPACNGKALSFEPCRKWQA